MQGLRSVARHVYIHACTHALVSHRWKALVEIAFNEPWHIEAHFVRLDVGNANVRV